MTSRSTLQPRSGASCPVDSRHWKREYVSMLGRSHKGASGLQSAALRRIVASHTSTVGHLSASTLFGMHIDIVWNAPSSSSFTVQELIRLPDLPTAATPTDKALSRPLEYRSWRRLYFIIFAQFGLIVSLVLFFLGREKVRHAHSSHNSAAAHCTCDGAEPSNRFGDFKR
jgi:hypothetical protein